MNKTILFFVHPTVFMSIMCSVFSQLQSMDRRTLDMQADALKIALMIRPDCFDRMMVRCLSEVNVGCSKAIRATVKYRGGYNEDYRALIFNSDSESRKQYFMNLDPQLELVKGLVWNCFGTVCAKASFGSELNWTLYQETREERSLSLVREVILERRSLLDACPIGNCAVWENFYNVLPHQPLVSFDGNFDVYIYACGAEKKQDHFGIDVLEYRLSSDHGATTSICMAEINGDMFPLAIFLEFPKLLKAFLSSSAIQLLIGFIRSKIFMLKGVELPADYEECEAYHEQVRHYIAFEKLPKTIRDALEDHYRAQSGEIKKKKGWRLGTCFGA